MEFCPAARKRLTITMKSACPFPVAFCWLLCRSDAKTQIKHLFNWFEWHVIFHCSLHCSHFFVSERGSGYRDDDSSELRPTAQVPPPATGQWEASNAASCWLPCIWRQSAWPQTQGPKWHNGDCVRLSAAINKCNAIKRPIYRPVLNI